MHVYLFCSIHVGLTEVLLCYAIAGKLYALAFFKGMPAVKSTLI